jgi:hypothetical protein
LFKKKDLPFYQWFVIQYENDPNLWQSSHGCDRHRAWSIRIDEKKNPLKDFEKKLRVRLARRFKISNDCITIKKILSILKCINWLIYLSDHVKLGLNYFLRPSAQKSKFVSPDGAKFKNSKKS